MKYKIKFIMLVAIVGLNLSACKQDKMKSENQKTSLMKFGFPIEINTPENASFIKSKSGATDHLIITNNKDFNLQINMSDAVSNSVTEVKIREIEYIKTNPFFKKILEDYDDGFLYEYLSPNGLAYDFRIFKLQGSKTYTFQTGITGQYSEIDVKHMIKSIR